MLNEDGLVRKKEVALDRDEKIVLFLRVQKKSHARRA